MTIIMDRSDRGLSVVRDDLLVVEWDFRGIDAPGNNGPPHQGHEGVVASRTIPRLDECPTTESFPLLCSGPPGILPSDRCFSSYPPDPARMPLSTRGMASSPKVVPRVIIFSHRFTRASHPHPFDDSSLLEQTDVRQWRRFEKRREMVRKTTPVIVIRTVTVAMETTVVPVALRDSSGDSLDCACDG